MIRSSLTAALFSMAAILFCLTAFEGHPYFSGPGFAWTAQCIGFVLGFAAIAGAIGMVRRKTWGSSLFIRAVNAALIILIATDAEVSIWQVVVCAAIVCAMPYLTEALRERTKKETMRFAKTLLGTAATLVLPAAVMMLVMTSTEPMLKMGAALIFATLWLALNIQPKTFLKDPV